jgi:hypothetical protein
VHCHIFNARDIPVVRFLGKVVLPEFLPVRLTDFDRTFLQPKLQMIGHGLEDVAISYEAESMALTMSKRIQNVNSMKNTIFPVRGNSLMP